VEVLTLPGCPSAAETLALVRRLAAALAPGTEVREIVLDEAASAGRGFPGSPTVLVDGRDVAGRQPHASGAS
jgi:hypothetical protein